MSSVVENQSLLTGRVVARSPHPSVERWDQLRLAVSATEAIDTQPNLLVESVGHQVTVAVDRTDLPQGDLTGWEFSGHVRLAGPEVVVAVPAAAGVGPPSLTRPSDDEADRPVATEDAVGAPPPAGTWPAGQDGPRPQL